MTKYTRQQHNKRKNKRLQIRKLELNAANIIANETPEESAKRLEKERAERLKLEELRDNFIEFYNNTKLNRDPEINAICEWDSSIEDIALQSIIKYCFPQLKAGPTSSA